MADLLSSLLMGLAPLFSKDPVNEEVQRFTPEQQQALSQLLQQGLSNTNFDDIKNQAVQQYQQEIVPSLAERFTSLGGGARSSSAFQGALARAGTQIPQQLSTVRSLMGLKQLGMGLTPRFDTLRKPAPAGWDTVLQGVGKGISNTTDQIMEILPKLLMAGI